MATVTTALKKAYDATWGKYFFAGMYDRFLARVERYGLSEKRAEFLAPAYGRTIELGTGTGLNLPHYPDTVTELVLTEPYPHMVTKLNEKVRNYPKPVQLTVAGAEKLPYPDASFDTVVAAMILCTVRDPDFVLKEIERLLKPGGQYLFLEHVRNRDPKIARRQDVMQMGWYWFGNECHCNRPTVDTLNEASLEITELKEVRVPGAWKFLEAWTIGRAVRRSGDAPATSELSAATITKNPAKVGTSGSSATCDDC